MIAPKTDYRRPSLLGLLIVTVLVCGGGAWVSTAQVASAVIASGSVVVQGKPKMVQHPDGGVISGINVRSGQTVTKGSVLVELDDTTIAANLAIYKARLREAIVRRVRLAAELEGRDSFEAPNELAKALALGGIEASLRQQHELMRARRFTRQGQIAQLDEKISQFENQIRGVTALEREKAVQLAAFKDELAGLAKLVRRKITSKSRLLSLQRAQADLRGQTAEHGAEIARIRNSIAETRISKLQVERQFREKVIAEIEQNDAKVDELRQQLEATRKQLSRVAIRSPVGGVVHELNVFTVGGVVQPGQTIMQIVPQDTGHDIELNVETTAIDQIHLGQRAIVRLPAFHQRTTPELEGEVLSISPSSVTDERTGFAFYRVQIEVPDEEMNKLGQKRLVPGMPVEGFVPTGERTVLDYLVRPLMDQLNHALREE